jgi:hypothetical protein
VHPLTGEVVVSQGEHKLLFNATGKAYLVSKLNELQTSTWASKIFKKALATSTRLFLE